MTAAVCAAPPGKPYARVDCGACGARAGDDCPRKTHTEKMIEAAGGAAKIGLARGGLAK